MNQLFGYPTPASLLWAAIALLTAGGVFWLARRKGPVLAPAWVVIGLLSAAACIPVAGYLRSFAGYSVHVAVLAPSGVSREQIKVWCSAQAQSVKVADGWRIDIPASMVPGDGVVMVWASITAGDLKHSKRVILQNDHNPTITIPITGGGSTVAGLVRDSDGRLVDDSYVSVADQPQTMIMAVGGRFVLPVPVEEGEDVLLDVFDADKSQRVWATAGAKNLVIVIDRPARQ